MNKEETIIPVWLRDLYCTVWESPVYQLKGPLNEDELDASIKLENNDILFVRGDDVFKYVYENEDHKDSWITFVINSLPRLFVDNQSKLDCKEQIAIDNAIKQVPPRFKNIKEYDSIDLPKGVNLFQLIGNIHPYNIVYVPVSEFIRLIKENKPIKIRILGIDYIIQISYEQFDFWDSQQQRLLVRTSTV